jgi:regulator of protease activity HflC (stomatin/prohibitin superfamily)
MNNLNLTKIVLGCLIGLFAFIGSFKILESVDADEIIVIQNPVSGTLNWYTTAGIKWQGFGSVTKYYKLETYEFKIPVRFNDGGHGTIVGSINYELPLDKEHLTQLHTKYGSQEAIQKQLVETVTNKCVYMTGPLLSSKESYGEKRTSLIRYIEDQIMNGVYRTTQKEVKTVDMMTGQEKTITVVDIVMGKNGQFERQEEAVLLGYGIKTSNFAVTELPYDKAVEEQIQQQQRAMMDIQTAMAEAKKAEQKSITVSKEGEAEAAKSKWEQEVIKARAVTEAQQQLEVNTLAAKAAEQYKRKMILEGEGEAEKKRLVMQADGALEKKIEAYVKVNEMYADAIKGYGGNWVPQIIMGGEGGKAASGANDLIDLLKVKTAMDLGLNMKVSGQDRTTR